MPTEAQIKYWESLRGKVGKNKGKHWKNKVSQNKTPEKIKLAIDNLKKWIKENGAWNRGLKLPQYSGEMSKRWIGEKASYGTIHGWIRRCKGTPKICAHCGRNRFA